MLLLRSENDFIIIRDFKVSKCTETKIADLEAIINILFVVLNCLTRSQLKAGFADDNRILIFINIKAFDSNLGSVIAHYCLYYIGIAAICSTQCHCAQEESKHSTMPYPTDLSNSGYSPLDLPLVLVLKEKVLS